LIITANHNLNHNRYSSSSQPGLVTGTEWNEGAAGSAGSVGSVMSVQLSDGRAALKAFWKICEDRVCEQSMIEREDKT
jgi:hypothetical protein